MSLCNNIWIPSSLPILFPKLWHYISLLQTCLESWPTPYSGNIYFVVANLVMCYLFPLSLISICYLLIWRRVCCRQLPGEPHGNGELMIHRSKVKVIKMLMVVIVLFACSWLPLYIIFTRIKLGGPINTGLEETLIHALLPVAQWLGASNSCINPILYAYFNRKFRAGFKQILSSRSCCEPLRYDAWSNFDGRTLSAKDSLMFSVKKQKGDLIRQSRNRMTISGSFKVKPMKNGSENAINSRAMSLRAPSNNVGIFCSNTSDKIKQGDGIGQNEVTRSCNGTFVWGKLRNC